MLGFEGQNKGRMDENTYRPSGEVIHGESSLLCHPRFAESSMFPSYFSSLLTNVTCHCFNKCIALLSLETLRCYCTAPSKVV